MVYLPAFSMTKRHCGGSRARRFSPGSWHLIHLGAEHQIHFFMDCDYNISMTERARSINRSHSRMSRGFILRRINVISFNPPANNASCNPLEM
jgi:hypothetical protein